MRLLMLVFTVLFGTSLLGVSHDAIAAKAHKKIKHAHLHRAKSTSHSKADSRKHVASIVQLKPSYRPSDVWERIRMGMQMYSLTDKFIFQTKGRIDSSDYAPDINSLLKSPAVQLRLYKFQRFNLNGVKKLLKQPSIPVISNTAKMHFASTRKGKNTEAKVLASIKHSREESKRSAVAEANTSADLEDRCGGGSLVTVSQPRAQHPSGFISAVLVQPGIYAPVEMPIDKNASKAEGRCSKLKQRHLAKSKRQASVTHINYSIKTPNPLQQKNVEARVNRQVEWFTKRPGYLLQVSERARPYLFHIVDELSKHKLPLELALLPIVESAYKATAQSPMQAAGLWQFIPSTGRDFNLKQDGLYDDRLDVTASTQAAIRYLSMLGKHYKGDWLLALAAYNCGQGKVDAARKQNSSMGLATDYWSLSLPEETQNYVPRLLALASIFADPAKYKVNVKPIRNEPYFVKLKLDHRAEMSQLVNKDLKTIAELANLSYEHFSRLNPGYLNKTLTAKGPFTFILPPANANRLQQRLNTLADASDMKQLTSPLLPVNFSEQFGHTTADMVNEIVRAEQTPI